MRCPDILVFCLSSLVSGLQPAPESVKLLETPGTSGAWRVDTRSEIAGSLKLPGANGQGKVLAVRGTSAIGYEERNLALDTKGGVERAVRVYHKAEIKRTLGDQAQESGFRPEARRVVLLRRDTQEVPFSPDSPLTRSEIELVRTDVFTSALAGLLPGREVGIGVSWAAETPAVRELTEIGRAHV